MKGLIATLAGLAAAVVPTATVACAVELILAVDVSGSIDEREFTLQMEGMASAFEHPSLLNAVTAQEGGVLVTLTQWSGRSRQRQVTDWHLLTDAGSMIAFAEAIRRGGRDWRNYSTAIGDALDHALQVGRTAPVQCERKIVDVSGDGVSNEGRAPKGASLELLSNGYTVNAIVIRGDSPDPVEYYQLNVIAGPRSFLEIARNFEDYPEAILRKLLREIEQHALISDAAESIGIRPEAR